MSSIGKKTEDGKGQLVAKRPKNSARSALHQGKSGPVDKDKAGAMKGSGHTGKPVPCKPCDASSCTAKLEGAIQHQLKQRYRAKLFFASSSFESFCATQRRLCTHPLREPVDCSRFWSPGNRCVVREVLDRSMWQHSVKGKRVHQEEVVGISPKICLT